MKKYCVIIDTYPSTEDERNLLVSNLKKLRDNNVDSLITSHHPCSPEIIENSDFFIFEKKNPYHYLDSCVINENLEGVKNPIYSKYFQIGEITYYDKVVVTGWSVAITSQLINSIKFLHGKGYDYAFYMVSDCIIPHDVGEKLEKILEKSEGYRNYFIKNSPIFGSWNSMSLFGFTIDSDLIERIPNLDFSENPIYQRFFPNHAGEDVVLKIWESDPNFTDPHEELDKFFGQNNWNMISSAVKGGKSALHFHTSSSIYVDDSLNNFDLVLEVFPEIHLDSVFFEIKILDYSGNVLLFRAIELRKFHWYKEDVSNLFLGRDGVILEKYIMDQGDETCSIRDSIKIDRSLISQYSELKKFRKN
jgi:hypothetical protein